MRVIEIFFMNVVMLIRYIYLLKCRILYLIYILIAFFNDGLSFLKNFYCNLVVISNFSIFNNCLIIFKIYKNCNLEELKVHVTACIVKLQYISRSYTFFPRYWELNSLRTSLLLGRCSSLRYIEPSYALFNG